MTEYSNDDELLKDLNNGNEQAFVKIYETHRHMILYYIKRRQPIHELAEELTSDTFTALHMWLQKGTKFNSLKHVKDWLFLVAGHLSINESRREKRRKKNLHDFLKEAELNDKNQTDNDKVEVEMMLMIHEAAEALPPECKRIFKMVCINEMSSGDAAAELKLSPQTVRNQKIRAYVLIRKEIRRLFGSGNTSTQTDYRKSDTPQT